MLSGCVAVAREENGRHHSRSSRKFSSVIFAAGGDSVERFKSCQVEEELEEAGWSNNCHKVSK